MQQQQQGSRNAAAKESPGRRNEFATAAKAAATAAEAAATAAADLVDAISCKIDSCREENSTLSSAQGQRPQ